MKKLAPSTRLFELPPHRLSFLNAGTRKGKSKGGRDSIVVKVITLKFSTRTLLDVFPIIHEQNERKDRSQKTSDSFLSEGSRPISVALFLGGDRCREDLSSWVEIP